MPASSKWRDLGARLGVLENMLAAIETDHGSHDKERCMIEMTARWLRRPQGEVVDGLIPTWKNLCIAMFHIDRVLARRLAKEHDCNLKNITAEQGTSSAGELIVMQYTKREQTVIVYRF